MVLAIGCLSAAAVALAATPRAGHWKGKSVGTPPQTLSFTVTSGGAGVIDFQPTFLVTCTKSGHPTQDVSIGTDTGTNIPVHNGSFSYFTKKATIHSGSHKYATATLSAHGTFKSAGKAGGTYSIKFTFNSSAPNHLGGYHCVSGTVQWNAHHT